MFEKILIAKLDEDALKEAGVSRATLEALNSAEAIAAWLDYGSEPGAETAPAASP